MLSEDLRHAWRAVRARPAFAVTVALLMALTIGANTAVFSLVDSVLLSNLPFRDPDRLVLVTGTREDSEQEPISIPDFLDVREQTRAFETLVPAFQWSANLTGGEAERLQGMKTSAAFFETLGAPMAAGRAFTDDDERSGHRIAIISHGLWVRRFGAADMLGSEIILNGDAHTVVGVLPDGFITPIRDVDVIAPFVVGLDPRRDVRDSRFLRVIGRLRSGVSVAQAEADVSPIVSHLQKTYPTTNGAIGGAHVEEWHRTLVSKARPALLLLQGVAAFVLLVACANLANLFLVAAVRREREFAVRTGPWRLTGTTRSSGADRRSPHRAGRWNGRPAPRGMGPWSPDGPRARRLAGGRARYRRGLAAPGIHDARHIARHSHLQLDSGVACGPR